MVLTEFSVALAVICKGQVCVLVCISRVSATENTHKNNAEIIVVGAPYWDLMFPAVLKNYFERVTVSGLTFSYGQNGIPKGHCKGKKLIYVTTSGGPIKFNFGYDYVAAIAKGFYGINDVSLVKAEGLDIYGADVFKILNDAKNSFKV